MQDGHDLVMATLSDGPDSLLCSSGFISSTSKFRSVCHAVTCTNTVGDETLTAASPGDLVALFLR